jgi:alpha-amylase
MEQIHGFVNEGQGNTYAYHGYWTRDWSSMEPNFGTEADLKELMEIAHKNNIRIMLDVIINHTGPVTDKDPVWPNDWVRTEPQCSYQNSKTTIECTLVENLPDILTEKTNPVELPADLLKKWQEEGRLEKDLEELEEFFA